MSPDDARHGTSAGYQVHRKHKEEPCSPCRAAKAKYQREHRKDPEVSRWERQDQRAYQWALRDLKRLHPAQYRALYLAHKKSLMQEEA